jgi:hypothetical protein
MPDEKEWDPEVIEGISECISEWFPDADAQDVEDCPTQIHDCLLYRCLLSFTVHPNCEDDEEHIFSGKWARASPPVPRPDGPGSRSPHEARPRRPRE